MSQRVRYLYTGQELDAESDLYNLNARLYNPATAHFISADPVQGPNRFAYAAANPVRFTDPTGQRIEDFTPEEWGEFRRQERLAAKPPRLPTDLLASAVTVSLDVQSPIEYSVSINEQVVAAIFQTLLPPGTNLSRRVIISPSISPPCPPFAPGCADVPGGGEVYLNPWMFPLSTEGLAVNLAPGFSQEDVYTFFLVSNLFHELHHSFLENWGVWGDPNRRFLEAEATGVGLAVASAYSGFSWEEMRATLESFRQGYLSHPQFSHYAPVLYPQITSEVYGYWRRIFESFEPVSVTIP